LTKRKGQKIEAKTKGKKEEKEEMNKRS